MQNQKWVTDISYIPTGEGFLYLFVIKDLYDRSIVGYRYATQMPTKLVLDTIRDAVGNWSCCRNLSLHSDNGFQYASIIPLVLQQAKKLSAQALSYRQPIADMDGVIP